MTEYERPDLWEYWGKNHLSRPAAARTPKRAADARDGGADARGAAGIAGSPSGVGGRRALVPPGFSGRVRGGGSVVSQRTRRQKITQRRKDAKAQREEIRSLAFPRLSSLNAKPARVVGRRAGLIFGEVRMGTLSALRGDEFSALDDVAARLRRTEIRRRILSAPRFRPLACPC